MSIHFDPELLHRDPMNSPEGQSRDLDSQAEPLFQKALDLPTSERCGFLQQACQGNSPLRQRVHELLAANESFGGILDEVGVESLLETSDTSCEAVGSTAGKYKLLQEIGEGGFGIVYMAEQLWPVKRKVAFKVIKPGMDSKSVIARFEAERQALALMEHPHIANVYDGGTTKAGRPYFVMELVKGVPITVFCDDNRLRIDERLALFVHVCEAVQHAHQKGIIHRDIKPSNVMVTLHDGKPVVKVIDFGVAKAMRHELTEKTLFTAYGQMIGTPQYMSPEQAEMSGLDVDTRSDIYSLGVLLFELLTGTTPIETNELKRAGLARIQMLIKDREPPRPSLRLSSSGEKLTHLANQRSTDPRHLPKEIRGDLDWIVMKSLAKERDRRYETAAALATDVRRCLNNQAVHARPPSTAYYLQKLAARNKYAVATALVVSLSLVVSLLATTYGFFTAKEAKRKHARDLYFADMTLAYQWWDENNYAEVMHLLNKYRNPADEDYRGFEWRYLWRATEQRREADVIRFPNVPSAVRFVDQGSSLCIAGWNGEIASYSLTDPSTVPTTLLEESKGRLVTNKVGRALGWFLGAKGANVDFVGHWEPASGSAVVKAIKANTEVRFGHLSPNSVFAFTPDGTAAVVCRGDALTLVVDPQTGTVLRTINAGSDRHAAVAERTLVEQVAITPDGKTLATASANQVWLWDIPADKLLWRVSLAGHAPGRREQSANALQFSPDGRQLALGLEMGPVRLYAWDVETQQTILESNDHTDSVRAVAYSPDGRILATGSRDNSIRLWSTDSYSQLTTLRGHSGIVNDVAFSPDGRQLVSVAQDYTVVVWHIDDFRARKTSFTAPRSRPHIDRQRATFPRDDKILRPHIDRQRAIFLEDDKLQGIDLHTSEPLTGAAFQGRSANAFAVGKSGDLAIASGNSIEVLSFRGRSREFTVSGRVTVLALGSNQTMLAFGTANGAVGIVNLKSGAIATTEGAHPQNITALALDDRDRYLASAGGIWGGEADTDILVWDVQTQELLQTLPGHLDPVTCLTFSADSQRIVSGSIDNNICVWQWKSYSSPLMTLKGHTASVRKVIFSPDGDRIVSCAGDRTIRFWDWLTGTPCGHIGISGDLQGISSIGWLDRSTLVGFDHFQGIHFWEGPTN